MGVTLYKPGNSCIRRGIRCEAKVFEPQNYQDMLDFGWYMTPEECYETKKETVKEPEAKKEEVTEEVLSDDSIRQKAKALGIKNWYNKGISKLKMEIEACQDN